MEVTVNDSRYNSDSDEEEQHYCICRHSAFGFMIMCDFCKEWYHGDCIKITERKSEDIDLFCCNWCKLKDPALKTTYKNTRRKTKGAKRKRQNSTKSDSFHAASTSTWNQNPATSMISASDVEVFECCGHDFPDVVSVHWKSTLSAADKLDCKELADIHIKMYDLKKQLEEMDIKLVKLIDEIAKCKMSENHFVKLQCDAIPIDEIVIQTRNYTEIKLELFFMKIKEVVLDDVTTKPIDDEWNIFCNQKIKKKLWCRKLKVLCPVHYKNFSKADEVCGYNLGEENGIVRYCGYKGRSCRHVNWEQMKRAELDIEKLLILQNLNALKNDANKLQEDMRSRGIDISNLMFKYGFERSASSH